MKSKSPGASKGDDPQSALRRQVLDYLRGGHAHVKFDKAVAGLPAKLRGAKPAGQPHTAWRLVEHMRITQWDILEFCLNAKHVSPAWPDDYWPAEDAPPSASAWNASIKSFQRDRRAFEQLIADPSSDLLAPIPHGQGQTLLREALLIIDHTGYHVGQLVIVRRLLGAWLE